MKLTISFLFFLAFFGACQQERTLPPKTINHENIPQVSPVDSLFQAYESISKVSISKGSVSNGKLMYGVPVPFSGSNFQYFDSSSYLEKRGFVNTRVREILVETYRELETAFPDYYFRIMECSNENGGEIWPHRTHQNGLSIDFMSPLIQKDKQSIIYDTIGTSHYLMQFDKNGYYVSDSSHQIDFEMIAFHLLTLERVARNHGMHIGKVIFKLELKEELFRGKYGQQLKTSSIYFARHLDRLINNLHDDHYHVDLEFN